MVTPESIVEEALRVREDYRRIGDEIRKDTRLSTAGMQEAIREAQDAANAKITQLREAHKVAKEDQVRAAERRVLSHDFTTDALSRRDAAARAAQLADHNEAAALLHTALRQDDDALAKEVLLAAIHNRWGNVVNDYAAARPSAEADLTLLWEHAHPDTKSVPDGLSPAGMALSSIRV